MHGRRLGLLFMISLLTMTACSPAFFPNETSPSLESQANLVALTETTPSPKTATAHPSQTVVPDPTGPILASPTAGLGVPVPFTGLQLSGSLNGWAWGWDTGDGCEHLWRTLDGGLTWMEVTPQTMDLVHVGYGAFLNPLTAWVGVCGLPDQECGLAKTTNGGETWAVVNGSLPIFDWEIRFFDDRNGISESYGVGAGKGTWMLRETHDGGVTWAPVQVVSDPAGLTPDFPGAIETCNICGDILYIDPQRLIVVNGNLASDPTEELRFSITMDRGRAWQTFSLPLPPGLYGRSWIHPLFPVFPDGQAGVLAVVLTDESLGHSAIAFYATGDGGLNWRFRSIVENAYGVERAYDQVVFVSGQDLFLRCGGDLCVSHDGAWTWQRLAFTFVPDFTNSQTENRVRSFDFGDAMTGLAIVGSGEARSTLWRTIDGGQTWTVLSPDLLP